MKTRSIQVHAPILAAAALVLAGGALLLRVTSAESPGHDDVLDKEIAAVQSDVAGASIPAERAAALAKLEVLLEEKASREAAREEPPASDGADAKKFADLETSSRQAAAEAARYSPVLGATGTGELLEGTPWNRPRDGFVSSTWWRGAPGPDGTRLAIWAGGFPNDPERGALLVRRFVDDGNGTVVEDIMVDVAGRGRLTIAGEEDNVLGLTAPDGTTLRFDIASGRLD